jgi:hypothetical protein
MNKQISYGLDYESKPQWGIVNPQILTSFYAMINCYAIWKKKKMMGAGEKSPEYYEFNQYLIETYMKLEAHFYEEKEEDFKEVHKLMSDFIDEKKDLTLDEKKKCIHIITRFLKKVGLTKIEVESGRRYSLLGSE